MKLLRKLLSEKYKKYIEILKSKSGEFHAYSFEFQLFVGKTEKTKFLKKIKGTEILESINKLEVLVRIWILCRGYYIELCKEHITLLLL